MTDDHDRNHEHAHHEHDRNYEHAHRGLTKREYFAAHALQGILADQSGMIDYYGYESNYWHDGDLARKATFYADELIIALKE